MSSSDITGIRSVRRTSPSAVVNVVTSTFDSSSYARVTVNGAVGAIEKCPPAPRSSSAANSDGLSKRGQQSQSIDPDRPTSAADRPFPMIP